MDALAAVRQKLPESLILEFLNANDDCTIDLVMLVELGVYTRKDTAVKALKREGFEENLDYSVLKRRATTTGISVVEVDDYLLTSDSFKELCMIADTSTGKLVRRYYIEVERRWKREQREKSKQFTIQPTNGNSSKEIERLIDELIDLAFKVCWTSADCVNNIQIRTAQEQKRLKAAFENQVDRQLLYSIAKKALTDVSHNVSHQHAAITGIAEKQLEPYKEYVLAKLQEWLSTSQVSGQLMLPPVVIVQRPQETRKKIEDFLDYLDTLSPEAYQAEFEKVPDLTEQERRHGRFSCRTIARYLGLGLGQNRTVSNIMRERDGGLKVG